MVVAIVAVHESSASRADAATTSKTDDNVKAKKQQCQTHQRRNEPQMQHSSSIYTKNGRHEPRCSNSQRRSRNWELSAGVVTDA
jgi:hypothetical protein